MEILSFDDDLIAEAGALLAAQHRRNRELLPELPARFEDRFVAQQAVTTLWRQKATQGVAAVKGGRLAGYLIGQAVIDPVWGRSAWMRPAGCALAAYQGADLVQDMYAVLAAPWVDEGIFFHFAVVPTADLPQIAAWFSLSFGIEQVHALQDLDAIEATPASLPPGLAIRRAGPEDRKALAELSSVIWQHQVQAPVWGIMLPEVVADQREGWAELVDDLRCTVWLALLDGQVVGCQGYWPAEETDDNLLIPPHCITMSIAATVQTARGRGVGQALTRHGLAQARAAGYRACETDWRSTNLQAARFWPRQGFTPMAYRLVRRVDPRIAWARGTALAS